MPLGPNPVPDLGINRCRTLHCLRHDIDNILQEPDETFQKLPYKMSRYGLLEAYQNAVQKHDEKSAEKIVQKSSDNFFGEKQ